MSLRRLLDPGQPRFCKFEIYDMRPILLDFYHFVCQICEIEAALKKGGVQYRLVDTLNCVHKPKSFLKGQGPFAFKLPTITNYPNFLNSHWSKNYFHPLYLEIFLKSFCFKCTREGYIKRKNSPSKKNLWCIKFTLPSIFAKIRTRVQPWPSKGREIATAI